MRQGGVELSVIVVAWNSGAALGRCLASVEGASKGIRTETVVVDNASTDGSAGPAAGRDGVTLIRNSENVGFATAVNQALSEAEGEVVLLLNPDAQIGRESLRGLMEAVGADGRIGIAGCSSVDSNDRHAPGYEMSFPGQRGASVAQAEGPGRDVAWVSGACLAARREMVKEIGPLDEGFFMYYEDVDWGHRAREAGWRVVTVPGVEIRHDLGESAAQVSAAERARWAAESRVRFYEKHYSPGRARWLRAKMAASALLGGVWRLVLAGFSAAARDGLQAAWARARAAVWGARAGRDRT